MFYCICYVDVVFVCVYAVLIWYFVASLHLQLQVQNALHTSRLQLLLLQMFLLLCKFECVSVCFVVHRSFFISSDASVPQLSTF